MRLISAISNHPLIFDIFASSIQYICTKSKTITSHKWKAEALSKIKIDPLRSLWNDWNISESSIHPKLMHQPSVWTAQILMPSLNDSRVWFKMFTTIAQTKCTWFKPGWLAENSGWSDSVTCGGCASRVSWRQKGNRFPSLTCRLRHLSQNCLIGSGQVTEQHSMTEGKAPVYVGKGPHSRFPFSIQS